METLSLRFDHGIAGSRSLGNNGGRQNVAESNHGTSYTVPHQQPVDIIIPSAAPSPEEDYVLKVVQQPEIAKVAAPKEKVRTPLDPPLVIELSFRSQESNRTYLSSPFFFGNVELVPERQPRPTERRQFQSAMIGGSLVSSLHKVRLEDSLDHAFFVFGDLNIKVVGQFQLNFTLFEMHKRDNGEFHVVQLGSILTNTFRAYASKDFPGQMESTQLSKLLCDQGIKLRIRKETSKRKAHTSDWAADHYMNTQIPMPNYPRGSYDPFHSGYGCNDQRHVRRRYSPPYPMGAAPGPSHQLPGISTLPPGPTLPHPAAHLSHTAGSLRSPATVLPLESSLPPVMRSHFTSMNNIPEHHQSRAWPPSSSFADPSSGMGRQEQNMHEFGSLPHLENHQHIPNAGRFPLTEGPRQEVRNTLSLDDRYARPPLMTPSYDHTPVYSNSDFRQNPSISGANRPKTVALTAPLPPIVPGPYDDGTHIGSAPPTSLRPETGLDERAAQPRQQTHRLNGTIGNQQQDAPSRRPGPQA